MTTTPKHEPHPYPPKPPPHTQVVACKVFQPEITYLGIPPSRVTYLDQGLHRTPGQLRRQLGHTLARLEQTRAPRRVVLVYGYCGGGLERLCTARAELVVPLVHDCIPLLLGRERPPAWGEGATFYLSPGWIDHGRTPLSEYHHTARRWGEEEARWVASRIMKGYRRVALIETLPLRGEGHWRYTCEMAALHGLTPVRVSGGLGWLRRLLTARAGRGVVVLPPGRRIEAGLYRGAPGAAVL